MARRSSANLAGRPSSSGRAAEVRLPGHYFVAERIDASTAASIWRRAPSYYAHQAAGAGTPWTRSHRWEQAHRPMRSIWPRRSTLAACVRTAVPSVASRAGSASAGNLVVETGGVGAAAGRTRHHRRSRRLGHGRHASTPHGGVNGGLRPNLEEGHACRAAAAGLDGALRRLRAVAWMLKAAEATAPPPGAQTIPERWRRLGRTANP